MDGFRMVMKFFSAILSVIGVIAVIYYAANKIISKTRYFCDEDADIIECECCECEKSEEATEEAEVEKTTEE